MATATADVTAADNGTGFLSLSRSSNNGASIRVKGTFAATVALQVIRSGETAGDALTIETYTAPVFKRIDIPGTWRVRLHVTAYTSGTVELGIYDDDN